jgi:hypothetical protein
MNPSSLSDNRIIMIRVTCVLFATSSFLLGGWMMLTPSSFWSLLGVGGNPLAEAIYGGAIVGEGAMFALGAIRPVRYVVFFQYLVVYKTMACLGGFLALQGMPSPPLGGWLLLGAWAMAGLISAAVFPWPAWRSASAALGAPPAR